MKITGKRVITTPLFPYFFTLSLTPNAFLNISSFREIGFFLGIWARTASMFRAALSSCWRVGRMLPLFSIKKIVFDTSALRRIPSRRADRLVSCRRHGNRQQDSQISGKYRKTQWCPVVEGRQPGLEDDVIERYGNARGDNKDLHKGPSTAVA